MTGAFEDGILRFEGLDDAEIAKLNERLADLDNLIAVGLAHQAQFNRVVSDLGPIIRKIIAKQRSLT